MLYEVGTVVVAWALVAGCIGIGEKKGSDSIVGFERVLAGCRRSRMKKRYSPVPGCTLGNGRFQCDWYNQGGSLGLG
jgi:hypothetical protein